MAQYIAWISLDNRELACGELELYLGAVITSQKPTFSDHAQPEDHILFFTYEGDEARFTHLAYSRRITKIVDTFSVTALPQKLSQTYDVPTYRVDFLNSALDISQPVANSFYKLIFKSIKNPKINLKHPHTKFCCFIDSANKSNQISKSIALQPPLVWIAVEIWRNAYEYEARRPHLREKKHSAVMPPKLMRVMLNLTGLHAGTICDPFCGTASILFEAMHNGFRVIGSDIDPKMLAGAKTNARNEIKALPHLKKLCDPQTAFTLVSATKYVTPADAIVTDVPYGKNTKKVDPMLYIEFLNHVAIQKLAKRIVICMPDFANGLKIIEKSPWKVVAKFSDRVHNSLSRDIFVLDLPL